MTAVVTKKAFTTTCKNEKEQNSLFIPVGAKLMNLYNFSSKNIPLSSHLSFVWTRGVNMKMLKLVCKSRENFSHNNLST